MKSKTMRSTHRGAGPCAARRTLSRLLLPALAATLLPLAAPAGAAAADNEWAPAKPLRMVVTFPPGGTADLLARIIGPGLGEALGQQVVVDNRPGAGGLIGSEIVARAGNDGLTFGLVAAGAHALNATLMKKQLPYDPVKDFTWITPLVVTPFVLVVANANPARSVADLLANAKAKGVPLNYGSPGNGTMNQIAGAMLQQRAGQPMTHIAYKGGAPAMNDIMGGQLDMMFNPVPSVQPYVQSGRLRGLAIGSATRSPQLPDVPTMAEAGFPDFEAGETFALVAPATMPPAALKRINAEVSKLLHRADIAERIKSQGMEISLAGPGEYDATVAAHIREYAKLIRDAGISTD
ncbi:tripartite tricarboxylate transporter substrate binding protein [Pigmentiphaga soli]|uniref:Tripartite tricarboxylate transporter substrate binding protein n=1 Tax=Pigmentiphaga soli TaxID=1007095 RepID=A0ABP8HLU1_9BURK